MAITRRQALLTISQLAGAAALAACGRSSQPPASRQDHLELLASVAYDILPFPELDPALYVQAASRVVENTNAEFEAGLAWLRDATSGRAWKDLDETTRIGALTSMQDTPFFRTVRATTIQVVLGDPAARTLVGYGGSAKEHGGYLHRGFDDISWLPADRNN